MRCKKYSHNSYRYAFNGKEGDFEIHNSGGTSYDYGFRIYDPRLGRFLSVDPLTKKYPHYTPYSFAGNTPIVAIDVDGKEDLWVHFKENDDGTFTKVTEAYELNDQEREHNSIAMGGLDIPSTGVVYTFQHLDGSYSVQKQIETIVVRPAFDFKEFLADGLNRFDAKMRGKSEMSMEGYKGFESYLNGVDDVGEGIEEVGKSLEGIPGVGKLLSKPFKVVGSGLGLAADFMKNAADIEQKGFVQGSKNATIRAAFFIGGGVVDKFINMNDLHMGGGLIKAGATFAGERAKDAVINQSNNSYYKSLQPFKLQK